MASISREAELQEALAGAPDYDWPSTQQMDDDWHRNPEPCFVCGEMTETRVCDVCWEMAKQAIRERDAAEAAA